jgi:tetratricopeptide (TPR) repeat protein
MQPGEGEQRSPPRRRRRHWKWILPLLLITLALATGAWRLWEVAQYRQALWVIDEQIVAGRPGLAARNLGVVLARKPQWDEALYRLGSCERSRGQLEQAMAAWQRITPSSPWWALAVQGCTELILERGMLDEAEQFVRRAQRNAPEHGAKLNALIALVVCQSGRFEEARQLIEGAWNALNRRGEGASEKAIELVRAHGNVESELAPRKLMVTYLEEAAQLAPEDDRVRLGQANLAIENGSLAEAAGLLDSCRRRRPLDVSVWRAVLKYAMAKNQLTTVLTALRYVPVAGSGPAEVPKVAAWIARQRGDAVVESRQLEHVIDVDPTDFPALARLAELASKAGQTERQSELRLRKAEIERLQARYRKLYDRNQPVRDAEEMGRLATKLGRWFEARGFLTIALSDDPSRTDIREELRRLEAASAPPRGTLAVAVAAELGVSGDQLLEPSSGGKTGGSGSMPGRNR